MIRRVVFVALAVVAFGVAGCSDDGQGDAPGADSDSAQSYNGDSKIPVDDNVYRVTVRVTAPVTDKTVQRDPAHGSMSGSSYGNTGYVSGSYTGPVESGKGFVRGTVVKSEPATDAAPVGGVVVLKSSDTKVTALSNGDTVTFLCRRQFEAVAAVRDKEAFDSRKVGTWELDYCRMASPVFTPAPSGE